MANGFQRYADGLVNLTDNVAADVLAAPGATERYQVTSVLVTNAHATVGTKVELRSGTTVKKRGFAASDGGGWSLDEEDTPHFTTAPGEAVTARCVTTGADVDVNITARVI